MQDRSDDSLNLSNPFDVAGLACLDLFHEAPDSFPGVGGLVIGPYIKNSPGGAVSNVGLALIGLGFTDVRMYGMAGNDLYGMELRKKLTQQCEHVTLRTAPNDATTAISTVYCYVNGDRRFVHSPMASTQYGLSPDDYPEPRASHLHIGYPPLLPATTHGSGLQILANVLAGHVGAGGTTSMDMAIAPASYPGAADVDWSDFLCMVAEYVTVFTPSIEELVFELDHSYWQDIRSYADLHEMTFECAFPKNLIADYAERLLAFGFEIVAIKLGAYGAYLRTSLPDLKQDGVTNPAWNCVELMTGAYQMPDSQFVGTNGAGDAMMAGLLAGMQSWGPIEAIRFGQAVAAFSTRAADATSAIEGYQTIASWMAHEDTVASIPASIAGWKYDPQNAVYLGPNHEQ